LDARKWGKLIISGQSSSSIWMQGKWVIEYYLVNLQVLYTAVFSVVSEETMDESGSQGYITILAGISTRLEY